MATRRVVVGGPKVDRSAGLVSTPLGRLDHDLAVEL